MCGLIAAFGQGAPAGEGAASGFAPALRAGMAAMQRRGPDGDGLWEEPGACLGHLRLAILDLDARAAQPMHSADGRYVLVFNGEIYNFAALRAGLARDGVAFRTTSDSEVILALFAAEGAAMLPRLQGMFALVIWDRVTRRAFAARDPYGIKPLYCATTQGATLFASQVRALQATGLVSAAPDADGQAGFWLLGSVPEPRTWYRDIQAIPSGHYAWVEAGRMAAPVCWHDVADAWRSAADGPPPTLSDAAMAGAVRDALRESVARHLVADVPVGVFLSGGIDSGALAGLMVEAGATGVEGVTIAYDEFAGSDQDEAPVAARIAAHYGIRHSVRRVTREEFLADLPRIAQAMDQPSIDGINTWYASKAVAERGLKVVVSGVGGDELFQGYDAFRQLPPMVAAWNRLARLPGLLPVGRALGNLQARRSGNTRWRHAPAWLRTIEGAWWLRRGAHGPDDLAALMGEGPAASALRGFDAGARVRAMSGPLADDPRLALSQIESTTYLRNQLLRDSDWASMDHGVELRTPLVDATLLANLAPLLRGFARFPGKSLLAGAPARPLPDDVTARRKSGFGIPVARWLREAGGGAGAASTWPRELARRYDGGAHPAGAAA